MSISFYLLVCLSVGKSDIISKRGGGGLNFHSPFRALVYHDLCILEAKADILINNTLMLYVSWQALTNNSKIYVYPIEDRRIFS